MRRLYKFVLPLADGEVITYIERLNSNRDYTNSIFTLSYTINIRTYLGLPVEGSRNLLQYYIDITNQNVEYF